MTPPCKIAEAVGDLKAGKMVILVDDENRENEGDLVLAAEKVTPGAMAPEKIERLQLPLQPRTSVAEVTTVGAVKAERKPTTIASKPVTLPASMAALRYGELLLVPTRSGERLLLHTRAPFTGKRRSPAQSHNENSHES